MKLAWDDIAVIFIALLGVALALDWWRGRNESSAPTITIFESPSTPTNVASYNDIHHATADSIE